MPEIVGPGFELLSIGVRRREGNYEEVMRVDQECEIVICYRLTKSFDDFWITMHMKNESGERMFSTSAGDRYFPKHHEVGVYEQKCYLPANFFNWGNYFIDLMAFTRNPNIEVIVGEQGSDILAFTLSNRELALGSYMGREPGDITPRFEYSEKKIE